MNMNFVWGGEELGRGYSPRWQMGGGGGGDFELHTPETQEQLSCCFCFLISTAVWHLVRWLWWWVWSSEM